MFHVNQYTISLIKMCFTHSTIYSFGYPVKSNISWKERNGYKSIMFHFRL